MDCRRGTDREHAPILQTGPYTLYHVPNCKFMVCLRYCSGSSYKFGSGFALVLGVPIGQHTWTNFAGSSFLEVNPLVTMMSSVGPTKNTWTLLCFKDI